MPGAKLMVSIPRQLIIQAILILANSFFAATEIAVISLNTTKLKKMIEDGDKQAAKLLKMAENPSSFLSTIQIGITFAGFLGSAFAADTLASPLANTIKGWGLTILSDGMLQNLSVIIITIILSFFTLVFGELVPKRIAQQKPLAIAKSTLSVINALSYVAKPLIWLISNSTNLILRALHLKTEGGDEHISEDDIRLMVDAGGQSGSIEEDEQEMIQNIFEFNDIPVSEIMTPQANVVALSLEDSTEDIMKTIKETGLSRFPVYGEDLNDIQGTLNSREFLINLNEDKPKAITDMLRPAYFVPETIKADQLFSDMQKKKVHIAIVIDEYGGTSGIITLEDLLEEIVGNIYDEYDKQDKPEIEKVGENLWRVQGNVPIDDLADELDIELPQDDGYDTIGGMILSTLHTIPRDGVKFSVHIHALAITVTDVEEHRICEVLVSKDLHHEDEEYKEEDEKEKENEE